MSEILKKKIIIKECDDSKVKDLMQSIHVNELIARSLVIRGLDTEEKALSFLYDDISCSHDPFLLKDMGKAVDLIKASIDKNEKIIIYGDYDVDGMTSVASLLLFFREIEYDKVSYYVPDRLTEGYGLNKDAIKTILAQGVDLMITVDTGTSAVEEVEYAVSNGMKVIITDHHECQENLPNAHAIINHKQATCEYPFKDLCGVGLAFKLIQAMSKRYYGHIDCNKYTDLVSIGTIADLVPLLGENRILVKEGFIQIKKEKNIGLKALMDVAGVEADTITAGKVGYILGPRLNAAGRLDSAHKGIELFTTKDQAKAIKLSNQLDLDNRERQAIEANILQEAIKYIDKNLDIEKTDIILVAGKEWHKGVVGIVASRLVEKYYRPSIVLAIKDGYASGSARSIEGFNIFEALYDSRDLFENFGGHEMAAGMTLKVEKLDELRDGLEKYSRLNMDEDIKIPKIKVDYQLKLSEITLDFIKKMDLLKPYGLGNPQAKYLIEGEISQFRTMGKNNNHIKIEFKDNNDIIDAVGFSMAEWANRLISGQKLALVGSPSINFWMGVENIQFMISNIDIDRESTNKIRTIISYLDNLYKKTVTKDNQDVCLDFKKPSRKDFVNTYRLLLHLEKKGIKSIYAEEILYYFRSIDIDDLYLYFIPLLVFHELDLIDLKIEDTKIYFKLVGRKKLELEDSKLYNKICL